LGSLERTVLPGEEREQFLAEPHIGTLSVVEQPDRTPLTIPNWCQYTPGSEPWVRTPQVRGKRVRSILPAVPPWRPAHPSDRWLRVGGGGDDPNTAWWSPRSVVGG